MCIRDSHVAATTGYGYNDLGRDTLEDVSASVFHTAVSYTHLLSIRSVTGKPILYIGMGEKLSDLEQFYPDRMASRILGMGDIQSLIEKAAAQVDEEQAKELSQKLRKAEFDYNDFLNQMQQIRKMGGMGSILSMMPGVGSQLAGVDMDEGERSMHLSLIHIRCV